MNDGRHDRLPEDLEPVADWIRAEQTEISGLDLDRIKRRAMAQAAQGRTETTRRPALAGLPSLWKGAYMGLRPRPFLTLLLLIGLLGVLPITALAAVGADIPDEIPVIGQIDGEESGSESKSEDTNAQDEEVGRDAAQTQYGGDDDDGDNDDGGNPGGGNGKSDDDDGGNGKSDKDDDDGDDEGPPPAVAGPPLRNDCPVFRRNFSTPAAQGQCATATQQALGGQITPAQACAQFSDRPRRVRRRGGRGFVRIRSDRAACLRAIQLSQTALLNRGP